MKLRLFLSIFILCFICGCGNGNKPTDATVSISSKPASEAATQGGSQTATEGTTEVISQPDTQPATKAPSPSSDFYPINTEGLEIYDAGPYKVIDPDNKRGLSTTLLGYGFGISSNGQVPQASINNQKRFDSMKVQALSVDIKSSEKTLYLTFDCGYEYQDNTSLILNTLKEKQAPAAFFCTYPFITSNSAKVQRMIDEGHIVGNHSTTHPNFPDITRIQMAKELYGVYEVLKREHNYETKYFRFPAGRNSDSSLDLVASQGYRSIFWSVAYGDWDTANQMGPDKAFATLTSRVHPGAVILLHGVSSDNVAILGKFIDWARDNGYTFRSLDDYYAMK